MILIRFRLVSKSILRTLQVRQLPMRLTRIAKSRRSHLLRWTNISILTATKTTRSIWITLLPSSTWISLCSTSLTDVLVSTWTQASGTRARCRAKRLIRTIFGSSSRMRWRWMNCLPLLSLRCFRSLGTSRSWRTLERAAFWTSTRSITTFFKKTHPKVCSITWTMTRSSLSSWSRKYAPTTRHLNSLHNITLSEWSASESVRVR